MLLTACSRTPPLEATEPVAATSEAAEPTEGDEAVALIARIERATQQWSGTCPQPNAQGLCVEFVAAGPEPPRGRCGARELGAVVVHPRNPSTAHAALDELAEVMTLAGCTSEVSCDPETLRVQPKDPAVARALGRALAAARLARADAQIEHTLALTLPSGLEIGQAPPPEGDALVRFRRALETKITSNQSLVEALTIIKQYDEIEPILRAALRVSWVWLHLSDELRAAEIPARLREDEQLQNTYCQTLREKAEMPRGAAREAALFCVRRAEAYGFTSDTVGTCRELLERLEP